MHFPSVPKKEKEKDTSMTEHAGKIRNKIPFQQLRDILRGQPLAWFPVFQELYGPFTECQIIDVIDTCCQDFENRYRWDGLRLRGLLSLL